MTYIMVWIEEKEKWYYFTSDFNTTLFPNGYADYYIQVENEVITSDTWNKSNEGKNFSECYNVSLWGAVS